MTLYELLITIIGTPPDEASAFALYFISCATGLMVLHFILYIMKLVGGMLKG